MCDGIGRTAFLFVEAKSNCSNDVWVSSYNMYGRRLSSMWAVHRFVHASACGYKLFYEITNNELNKICKEDTSKIYHGKEAVICYEKIRRSWNEVSLVMIDVHGVVNE